MKIGIVGCGLNSDYHINFAKAYPGLEIAGIVDKNQKQARECAAKHGIKNVYSSIGELVANAKPEVIHILTPPKTHVQLAKEAIGLGCHVLLEKPMTLNYNDAVELFELAEKKGVKLCTMHNHMFDPCMANADKLVKDGSLGQVMNVESYYGLNTRIPAFRDYPEPNKLPWLYDLPGGVYQDFLPHPLYVLLEYTGKPKEIKVMSKAYGTLPQNLPDEIRVLVDGEKAFGTMTFSFAAKPHLHFIKIYGTKMMAEVDINTMTTVIHPLSSLPKAAQKATYNLAESWQLFTNTTLNVKNFVTGKLKPYQGMKVLIHKFYDSIRQNSEPPVSKEQALMVIKAIDEISRQLPLKPLSFEPVIPESRPAPARGRVLVTGGTGFLGKRLVELLDRNGYGVRVLARKLSNINPLQKLGVEIFFGDVADENSLDNALEGIEMVVHAAAGTSGSEKDSEIGTIRGTKNVIEACRRRGVKKLVYISSCSVYGVADYKKNQLVDESASLERFPSKRGNYSASKQEAEQLVVDSIKKGLPAVILRPGTIYGPGGDLYTPMMGFSMGNHFVVIGSGRFELPFVYIDNLVEAVIKSMQADKALGQVFNVVDNERVTKKEYMKKVIRKAYPGAKVFYLPFTALYLLTWGQEFLTAALKRKPFLTRYRLISSQKSIRYDSSKLMKDTGWKASVNFDEAAERIIRFERSKA